MSLQFEMPQGLTADKLIAKLSHFVDCHLVSREKAHLTFYDSFDWRLYADGLICAVVRTQSKSTFSLQSLKTQAVIASTELSQTPVFAKDFKNKTLREMLDPILEMRALAALCSLDFNVYSLTILNSDKKTVLRIQIEEYEHLNNRVVLLPVKGYQKAVSNCEEILSGDLGLLENEEPLLLAALKHLGSHPLKYSSKMTIKLDPDVRADIATKAILNRLQNIININEQGVIADIDSEFLHDFRVAVRRTRTGLSQLKEMLPQPIHAQFTEFFSWLGQITSPTRDFDVYLLNFEQYKSRLPISIREDINPLYDFLQVKKSQAHHELVRNLRSQKYRTAMAEWASFLEEASSNMTPPFQDYLSIKQLANSKIWKNFKRVLRQGLAINNRSSADALHDLRKACKKLRYLIEFFQSLYSEHKITVLLKKLKDLQEVLGDYQDFDVQECNLKQFSQEMLSKNTPVNTCLAMGVLIQNLDTRKIHARKLFESRFESFIELQQSLDLKDLFSDQLAKIIQE